MFIKNDKLLEKFIIYCVFILILLSDHLGQSPIGNQKLKRDNRRTGFRSEESK